MARDNQNGTANVALDCTRCNGTGQVMVGEQPNADGTGVKPRYGPCRACDGTGEEAHR